MQYVLLIYQGTAWGALSDLSDDEKKALVAGSRSTASAPASWIPTRQRGSTAPEMRAQVTSTIASGRIGRAADIADVVVFLASDNAGWITGESIEASGGQCSVPGLTRPAARTHEGCIP